MFAFGWFLPLGTFSRENDNIPSLHTNEFYDFLLLVCLVLGLVAALSVLGSAVGGTPDSSIDGSTGSDGRSYSSAMHRGAGETTNTRE